MSGGLPRMACNNLVYYHLIYILTLSYLSGLWDGEARIWLLGLDDNRQQFPHNSMLNLSLRKGH